MIEEPKWVEEKIALKDKSKLHLRPAQKIAETAAKFSADAKLELNGEEFNAKSLLDMILFAASLNNSSSNEFNLRVKGTDSADALKSIQELIHGGFDEFN